MITNLRDAVRHFIEKYLDGKGKIVGQFNVIIGPIAFRVESEIDGTIYWVMLKNDWFNTFARFYPQTKHRGKGQTCNYDLVLQASVNDRILVIVMPDESVYACSSNDWLNYVHEYNTIRKPDYQPTQQRTQECSVPDYMLRPARPHPNVLEREGFGRSDLEPKDGGTLDGWM